MVNGRTNRCAVLGVDNLEWVFEMLAESELYNTRDTITLMEPDGRCAVPGSVDDRNLAIRAL